MKIVEIIVAPSGEAQVQTRGFAGAECQEASRFIEQALGTRRSEQLTAEFHAPQPVARQSQQAS